MEAASIAHAAVHGEDHGPPAAHNSSRVEPQLLGMLLFIISEVMVFGAFFTAYFFIRIAQGRAMAGPGNHPAGGGRGLQHSDTDVLLVYASLGPDSDQTR